MNAFFRFTPLPNSAEFSNDVCRYASASFSLSVDSGDVQPQGSGPAWGCAKKS